MIREFLDEFCVLLAFSLAFGKGVEKYFSKPKT